MSQLTKADLTPEAAVEFEALLDSVWADFESDNFQPQSTIDVEVIY